MFRLNSLLSVRALCLLVPVSAVALTMADVIMKTDVEQREQTYRQEQARIDLILTEFQLEAARGLVTAEEAQTKTDEWLRANGARLQTQADLAAELDRLAPLPAEPSVPPQPSPVMAGSPEAPRFMELEAVERQAMAELKTQASGVELQGLVDAWAHSAEGSAVLEEKQKLWHQAAERRPFATLQTETPELPPNASGSERAIYEIQVRAAARLRETLAAHPEATPEEMQTLIDEGKEESDADAEEIITWQREVIHEKLEAEAAALRSQAEAAPEPPQESESDGN